MKFLAGLLLIACLAPTAVLAQTAGPTNIEMTRGVLTARAEVLFISDRPVDAPCLKPCSVSPFMAAADAVEGGIWTLRSAPKGRQWLYDGAPLFVWPEIGSNFGRHFFGFEKMLTDYWGLRPAVIKDPIGEGFAVAPNDPHVATAPRIARETIAKYNNGSFRGDTGTVDIYACIDRRGATGRVSILTSSGSAELDEIALDFMRHVPFVPAATSTGEPLAICGKALRMIWPGGPRSAPQLESPP
jgi:TonB family protein